MTLSLEDLYSLDPTRIQAALDAGERAWLAGDHHERLALERAMVASRSRLTAANGRALLKLLDPPRPAWVRWLCACAGPPNVTAVSPGFQLTLATWVREAPEVVDPLALVLWDESPDLRRFAQSAAGHFAAAPDLGGPRIAEGLWHGEAQGDFTAGVVLARHALDHGHQAALERVLQAPGDAARGAIFSVDKTPGLADLSALQPVLEHLEKKGAKASRECASRILARLLVERGDREALLPRLFRRNAAVRAHTAAGLRNAARDGIDISVVHPDLERVVDEAKGFRKRAAQEALAAAGPDRIEVGMGSGSGSLSATVDLDRGILERHGSGWVQARYRIPPSVLTMLRRRATAAHARGDRQVREQFALAGVTYSFHLAKTTVTWTFEVQGSRTDPLVEPIYSFVSTPDARMEPDLL